MSRDVDSEAPHKKETIMLTEHLKEHVLIAGTTLILLLNVGAGLAKEKEVGELTDGRMEGAIERRLDMDSRIMSNSVGVTVNDGNVRLFGSVDTLQERGQATQVASSVMGVKSIHNGIKIRPHPQPEQQIQEKFLQGLRNTELLKDHRIEIRVADRVITLIGTVPNQRVLRQAQRVAESIEGVQKVENLLGIEGSRRSDEAIRQDVLHYILWSPLANPKDFTVSVSQGVVTLEGTVEHLIHKDVLAMDIENIHGVKAVRLGKVIPKKIEITLKTH